MALNSPMARVLIAFFLVLPLPVPKGARAEGTELQSAFVQALVEAMNGRNPGQQKALLHPGSLDCGNAEATGEDITTAKEVVELLSPQER